MPLRKLDEDDPHANGKEASWPWSFQTVQGFRFRVLGFRVLGFRVLGFRELKTKGYIRVYWASMWMYMHRIE